MRAYHANILFPELPASRAEFGCTVYASSLHTALREVGKRAEAHKGRARVETVRITLRYGAERVPEPLAGEALPRPELEGLAAAYLTDDGEAHGE
jgi:hypothetical protein